MAAGTRRIALPNGGELATGTHQDRHVVATATISPLLSERGDASLSSENIVRQHHDRRRLDDGSMTVEVIDICRGATRSTSAARTDERE
jgi:hypothetical protein